MLVDGVYRFVVWDACCRSIVDGKLLSDLLSSKAKD